MWQIRLAIEKAPVGLRLLGRTEDGGSFRAIAETIGKHLNLLVSSILHEEAKAHFGFLGVLAALDIPSVMPGSRMQTKELLGWRPVQSTLIEDLE